MLDKINDFWKKIVQDMPKTLSSMIIIVPMNCVLNQGPIFLVVSIGENIMESIMILLSKDKVNVVLVMLLPLFLH